MFDVDRPLPRPSRLHPAAPATDVELPQALLVGSVLPEVPLGERWHTNSVGLDDGVGNEPPKQLNQLGIPARQLLADGDRIELVTFFGGG